MSLSVSQARIQDLHQLINQLNHQYYDLDDPNVPDAEYDRHLRELQALEAEFPELKTLDSSSQKVGGQSLK